MAHGPAMDDARGEPALFDRATVARAGRRSRSGTAWSRPRNSRRRRWLARGRAAPASRTRTALVAWCVVVAGHLRVDEFRSPWQRRADLRGDLDEAAAGVAPDAAEVVATRRHLDTVPAGPHDQPARPTQPGHRRSGASASPAG